MIYREGLDRRWLIPQRGGGAWVEVPAEVEAAFSQDFEKDPRATHPFRAGKLLDQARLFTMAQLRECQRALAGAHEALVSSGVPQSTVLEMLLVEMLS